MRRVLLLIVSFCLTTAVFGQDHLLMTEFAVTPTEGEFVEIYNPTDAAIDLSDYYLTDATFAGGGAFYYNLSLANTDTSGGGGFGDFNARFPDGSSIAPGEHQTVALLGDSLFFVTYGVLPTYELYEDGSNFDDDVADMRPATDSSIDTDHAANVNFGVLSNSGEVLILYYWDGASDLVQDVDYVVWGDKAEAIDKTGVTINGSTYGNDTPIADQTVVNADNDDDETPHDFGMTAQRVIDVEDLETWIGGNGITGHDETSENTSWKGGIWAVNRPATPGTRAAGKPASDSLTIADIQFVRAADIGNGINNAFDDTPLLGETVSITGIFMQGPREIFLSNRWGGFLQDPNGGPWSGIFVVQHDTTAGKEATLLPSAAPGDLIRVTGVLEEFPNGPSQSSFTQIALVTDPITQVDFLEFGLPLPDPINLEPGDLGFVGGNSANPELAERWEGTFVRFEGLTVTANPLPGGTISVGDGTGTIILDDYFNAIFNAQNANGGVWPGLPAGTIVNVNGFVRGASSNGFVTINPRTLSDVEVASAPPEITNVSRLPAVPGSSESVQVSTLLRAGGSPVASGSIFYRVNSGAYTEVALTTPDSVYSATIPAQANQDTVEYFLKATGDDGFSSIAPGDTSAARFFYIVRDGGATIADIQFTPFPNGNSPYTNLEVTVTGIATTDSAHFAYYWIQDGVAPWSGVWVNDSNTNVKIGDEVRVTGIVEENFGATRINTTAVEIISSGNQVPEPVLVPTGNLGTGSATAESYEGMLVTVENVEATDVRPDGIPGFGEFVVDDGSGGVRVEDESAQYDGQTPSDRSDADTTIFLGDKFLSITGIQHYTFNNYKIEPRSNDDVVRDPTSVASDAVPLTFALEVNYPNPFNPETTIEFQVAKVTEVKLEVFNVLGQRIRTLVNEAKQPGKYKVTWRAANDLGLPVSSGVYVYRISAGDFVKVHKMLLLK